MAAQLAKHVNKLDLLNTTTAATSYFLNRTMRSDNPTNVNNTMENTENHQTASDSDLSVSTGSALGYALCKCWKDNPNDLAVHEYYGTLEDAKEAKRSEKKDPRYTWVIGEYK